MQLKNFYGFLFLVFVSTFTHAQQLQLEIRIQTDDVVSYDVDQLEALGMHETRTETPWFEGNTVFSGPLLRDVLKAAGFNHDAIKATALNDYFVTIPTSDAQEFDVIVATRINGERLSVRDRGPFWVIYPYTEENLTQQIYLARSIWQLNLLEPES